MRAIDLFERIVFSAKRLVLDYDLSDNEAKEIAAATDKVNEIREQYTDRKLDEVDNG
jgi:hypothetical protein